MINTAERVKAYTDEPAINQSGCVIKLEKQQEKKSRQITFEQGAPPERPQHIHDTYSTHLISTM